MVIHTTTTAATTATATTTTATSPRAVPVKLLTWGLSFTCLVRPNPAHPVELSFRRVSSVALFAVDLFNAMSFLFAKWQGEERGFVAFTANTPATIVPLDLAAYPEGFLVKQGMYFAQVSVGVGARFLLGSPNHEGGKGRIKRHAC